MAGGPCVHSNTCTECGARDLLMRKRTARLAELEQALRGLMNARTESERKQAANEASDILVRKA